MLWPSYCRQIVIGGLSLADQLMVSNDVGALPELTRKCSFDVSFVFSIAKPS